MIFDPIKASISMFNHRRNSSSDRPVTSTRCGQDVVSSSSRSNEGRIREDTGHLKSLFHSNHVESQEMSVTSFVVCGIMHHGLKLGNCLLQQRIQLIRRSWSINDCLCKVNILWETCSTRLSPSMIVSSSRCSDISRGRLSIHSIICQLKSNLNKCFRMKVVISKDWFSKTIEEFDWTGNIFCVCVK